MPAASWFGAQAEIIRIDKKQSFAMIKGDAPGSTAGGAKRKDTEVERLNRR